MHARMYVHWPVVEQRLQYDGEAVRFPQMHFEGESYQCETEQTQSKREEKIEKERKFKERNNYRKEKGTKKER